MQQDDGNLQFPLPTKGVFFHFAIVLSWRERLWSLEAVTEFNQWLVHVWFIRDSQNLIFCLVIKLLYHQSALRMNQTDECATKHVFGYSTLFPAAVTGKLPVTSLFSSRFLNSSLWLQIYFGCCLPMISYDCSVFMGFTMQFYILKFVV